VGPDAEERLENLYQGLADLARTFRTMPSRRVRPPLRFDAVSQAIVAWERRWPTVVVWQTAGFTVEQVITGLVDFAFLGLSGGPRVR
jgi:hypothetical protein